MYKQILIRRTSDTKSWHCGSYIVCLNSLSPPICCRWTRWTNTWGTGSYHRNWNNECTSTTTIDTEDSCSMKKLSWRSCLIHLKKWVTSTGPIVHVCIMSSLPPSLPPSPPYAFPSNPLLLLPSLLTFLLSLPLLLPPSLPFLPLPLLHPSLSLPPSLPLPLRPSLSLPPSFLSLPLHPSLSVPPSPPSSLPPSPSLPILLPPSLPLRPSLSFLPPSLSVPPSPPEFLPPFLPPKFNTSNWWTLVGLLQCVRTCLHT